MTDPIAEPQQEKVNSFQRIIGVLFSPSETFASIARRPDFAVPLIIVAIVSCVTGWTIASRVDFVSMMREAMEANPQSAKMAPEQMDRMVRMTAGFSKAVAYASPLVSIVALIIVAGIIFLAFRMFGGVGNFKQAFSVTVYAWYPALIKSVIAVIVLINRKSISMFDLQSPVRSNLAFLVDPKTHPVAFTLLTSLDLFSIWSCILFIIGFAAFTRLSKARSAAIVISLWVVAILLKLIGPAISALKAK